MTEAAFTETSALVAYKIKRDFPDYEQTPIWDEMQKGKQEDAPLGKQEDAPLDLLTKDVAALLYMT